METETFLSTHTRKAPGRPRFIKKLNQLPLGLSSSNSVHPPESPLTGGEGGALPGFLGVEGLTFPERCAMVRPAPSAGPGLYRAAPCWLSAARDKRFAGPAPAR